MKEAQEIGEIIFFHSMNFFEGLLFEYQAKPDSQLVLNPLFQKVSLSS